MKIETLQPNPTSKYLWYRRKLLRSRTTTQDRRPTRCWKEINFRTGIPIPVIYIQRLQCLTGDLLDQCREHYKLSNHWRKEMRLELGKPFPLKFNIISKISRRKPMRDNIPHLRTSSTRREEISHLRTYVKSKRKQKERLKQKIAML